MTKKILLSILALSLFSCGFQIVYKEDGGKIENPYEQEFAAIRIKKTRTKLDQDLKNLLEKWKFMYANLKTATPPKRVLGELDKTSSILRDLLNADFSNIHINDVILMTEMSEYITDIAPGREKILTVWRRNFSERLMVYTTSSATKPS
jgi:Ribonuclease G/E